MPRGRRHNWGDRPRATVSARVKDQVRRRDGFCQLGYPGCTQRIEEFDHIVGLAAQGISRTPVLSATEVQGVCKHCHAIKSEQQRRDGIERAMQRRGSLSRRYRDREEKHPGELT